MALIDDEGQLVRAYVAGHVSRAILESWLAQNAQAVADAHDSDASALFGRASSLLAEFGYGHRSEPEVRSELAAFLGGVRIDSTQWMIPPVTSTFAAAMPAAAQFSSRSISFRSRSDDMQRSPVIA